MVKGMTRCLAATVVAGLAAFTSLAAQALDAIPLYDVVSIAAELDAQFENVGISSAASVNENGDAVGYAIIDGDYQAFVYTEGRGVELLPTLTAWGSHQAFDVTDRFDNVLVIVGVARSSIYGDPQTGVVWEYDTLSGSATVSAVGPLPGGSASSLTDINNNGLAVGSSISLGAQAMVYDHLNGTTTQLDLPSVPSDINDANTVAGDDWRASLTIEPDGTITAGPPEFLGGPPSSWWTTIHALNADDAAAARVVMTWSDGAGRRVNGAALYDEAGWWLLWASSAFDGANGINDHKDVVGALGVSAAIRSALYIAALDQVYLIEDLIDPASPYGFIDSVADINNAGTIAAGGGAALLVRKGDMPAPAAPANLTAAPHYPTWQQPWNAITLNWQDTSDYTIDFTIERREPGQPDSAWSMIRSNWSPTSMWDMDVGLGVTYEYRVRARGLAGLSAYSNLATATAPADPVDTEAPVVTITKPVDGATVSGRVKIRAEATDNVEVTSMDITVSSNLNSTQLCSGAGPVLECTWNTRKLENGTYTIRARASDAMGNGSSHSITVTLGDEGGGTSFDLLVSDIAMQARVKRRTPNVTGTVVITDGNGSPVKSAMVYGTWTLPSGATQSRVVYTSKSGKAVFEASDGFGTYVLDVTNVVKSGYSFDPACCTLSNQITVN